MNRPTARLTREPMDDRVAGALAFAADVALIVLFVILGRMSHEHGLTLSGIANTAAPFLTGAAMGWVGCLGIRRRAPLSVRDGIMVWAGTFAGGLGLRAGTEGQGTTLSFILVAGLVTAVLLLGWRLVAGRFLDD